MVKNSFQLLFLKIWVGHKLGEFSPTRTFFGHTPAEKKGKPAEKKK